MVEIERDAALVVCGVDEVRLRSGCSTLPANGGSSRLITAGRLNFDDVSAEISEPARRVRRRNIASSMIRDD
jgi:hypothetical protein